MAEMLFKVVHGKKMKDVNPELHAIEQFSKLTDRQMVYVALVADYGSPYRQLQIEERKRQAALQAGYRMETDNSRPDKNMRSLLSGKTPHVKAALDAYSEMQYDEDREAIKSISAQIEQFNALSRKGDIEVAELEKLMKMSNLMPTLVENKKKLEEVLGIRKEDEDVYESNSSLSALDKYNNDN